MKKGEILDKVYKSNLPSRAKQIMFYLINRANAEGTCFPSVRTMASDCGVSERTIQRTMKVLFEEGFVIKENRYRGNGGQSSNLYKLQIEPENQGDKTGNDDEEKIKEENVELKKEKIYELGGIEIVTFDDYKEATETKDNNLNKEKETENNILVQESPQVDNYIIKPKCHPIVFHKKTMNPNLSLAAIPSIYPCHGVGDNLYPP